MITPGKFFSIIPMMIGVLIVLALNRAEYYFMPVITNFRVTDIERTDGSFTFEGDMNKVRACKFIGIEATSDTGAELQVHFLDRPVRNITRPVGSQGYGPWQVYIPNSPPVGLFTLTVLHDCHPAWTSRTVLAILPVEGK